MPNTDIAVRLDERVVSLDIRIPVLEFVLAFPKSENVTPDNLLTDSREKVATYFKQHLKILSKDAVAQDYEITYLGVASSSDEFVGDYQELRVTAEAPVRDPFNPHDFLLDYDAVIHQVPNHFALVKIAQDFNNGVFGEDKAVAVGAIRYDFSSERVPPLDVTATGGGIFKGFYSMAALGMQHIRAGTDHILFLLTLIVVAPLAVKDGGWTLFQGFGYTLRRFLAVSFAFTVGHSAALVFGTFDVLSVNQRFVEVTIAASVLLTAVHAMRPLFSRREALVALGFGVVHGLAFSEVLKSLRLAPLQKAISILGFNAGVELMQVIIMALAIPFLLISLNKIYNPLRITFAAATAIVAGAWIIERVIGSVY